MYLAAHNLLLAHGEAVKIYRENFQKKQSGLIGFLFLLIFPTKNNCTPNFTSLTKFQIMTQLLNF